MEGRKTMNEGTSSMAEASRLLHAQRPGAKIVGSSLRGGYLLLRVRAPGHEGSLRFRFDGRELVQISTSDRKHGGEMKEERKPVPDRRKKLPRKGKGKPTHKGATQTRGADRP
jgi:hypothetical protein